MSYNPQIYLPNVEKAIFTTIDDSTHNGSVVANDRIWIDSSNFSHSMCSVNASGQLNFTGGEHIICASLEMNKSPTNTNVQTPLVFQWYDVTNSAFIGTAGRVVAHWSQGTTNTLQNAPLCTAYVSGALIVEIRCVSQSGSTANCYNSLNRNWYGNPWGYVYSPI